MAILVVCSFLASVVMVLELLWQVAVVIMSLVVESMVVMAAWRWQVHLKVQMVHWRLQIEGLVLAMVAWGWSSSGVLG